MNERTPTGIRARRLKQILGTALLFLAACSSGTIRPQTGDISFRLLWSGATDLDLYVASPVGEQVDYVRRTVPSGGTLDIDCNHPYASPCAEPVENVFWPRGDAPRGIYRYWIGLAAEGELDPQHQYTLQVRIGKRVVKEHTGTIIDLRSENQVFEIDY